MNQDSSAPDIDDRVATLINEHLAQFNGDLKGCLRDVLQHVPALLAVTGADNRVVFSSEHFSRLAGVPLSFAQRCSLHDLFPKDIHVRIDDFYRRVHAGDLDKWEITVKHRDDTQHTYQLYSRTIAAGNDEHNVLTLGVDVTAERHVDQALREYKSQIAYMTFHDPLTGLPNRSLFYDRMAKSLSRAKRTDNHLAILLIDLDRFKQINDNLGRDAGDIYLKSAANLLSEALRDTDTVARLSGDEFVVVLEDVTDACNIEKIANKILAVLSEPVDVNGEEISCTASIGVSLYPKDGDTTDKLLRSADLAMYRAKISGKNRLQFYAKAMTESAVNYLLLENDLRKAIDNEELLLHYQPQIDLKSSRIVGLEALVRWQHPERGLISPIEFIPLAEETGLIEPIGEWVLRHACKRFQNWLDQGVDLGKVAVNLSARQFRHDDFSSIVEDALRESGLKPEYLELEITESSVMENAGKIISILNGLNEMGLSLAIDDFGTGYSSLAYLKKFPIQKLKVDRSFIKDIDTDPNDAVIAKSIIDLGHNMSLKVIAEGVERKSQTTWLTDKGCDQVQGFFYSKPLDEEALLRMVRDEKRVCNDEYCIFLTN